VLADALARVGVTLTADAVARRFHGRRPADIFAAAEQIAERPLPANFAAEVAAETLRRLRADLRAVPHAVHALTWIRGPKAVASSSPSDRIRLSLDITNLLRFFEPRLFSASEVANGKPAPDLYQLAARACLWCRPIASWSRIRLPASPRRKPRACAPSALSAAATTKANSPRDLHGAGARAVIADLRALKGAIIDLRGW